MVEQLQQPAAAAGSGTAAADEQQQLERRLFDAAAAGNLDAVQAALEAGADVSWADGEGTSALMAAAENGHAAVVAALLQAGSPWNAQDHAGYCAGEYATASRNQDIVELLLEWGVQAELLLAAAERDGSNGASSSSAANAGYLQQKLTYTDDGTKLLDADGEAVMMGWEAPLMERHAAVICSSTSSSSSSSSGGGSGEQQTAAGGGGHYLNVGFGLGIIDTMIQGYRPASHTIIEAHPDVHTHMLATGWGDKPGVRILFGRWQDVLDQLQPGTYDGIFFDTYGEYYEELRQFHLQLPRLLAPRGVYSFFNGLASDNFFFHMVYGRLIQVELSQLALATRYEQLRVAELGDDVWQGVRNKYWRFPVYFLPLVTRVESAAAEAAGGEQQGATAAAAAAAAATEAAAS